MLQKTTLCCLFLLSFLSWGQITDFKAPDYEAIEKAIQDQSSDVYYPALLRQYKSNTLILTPRQYEHLYYGYTFQKTYNPQAVFSKEKELQAYMNKLPDMGDIPAIKALINEALEEFPFNFRSLLFLSYIYDITGEEEKSKLISGHFESLAKVITHSGDGLTCETAFHVISASHEHSMLDLFSIESVEQHLEGSCDFIAIDPELYTIPGLYFDVSRLQQAEKKKTKYTIKN